MTSIHGQCDPRFERVREVFAANFDAGEENGAALAVRIAGRTVVDLWGGFADEARKQPWQRETIVNVYSTTKGLTAICAHRLVDQRRLDLDAPVARYWPEFAAAGKTDLPVRYLLSHRAGMAAIREPLPLAAMFDWDAVTRALARQEPWWKPGEKHGYHALTFGWLVGEVVRRISGKSLGQFFREEVAGPLGADAHIGLDPAFFSRVAEMGEWPPADPDAPFDLMTIVEEEPESVSAKAFANPANALAPGVVNSTEWRSSEIPAGNGHASARALARIYGALAAGGEADGYAVLSRDSLARCHEEQSRGPDEVLRIETRFGPGFMLSLPESSLGPNPRSFGHPGAGGSLGYADLDAQVGFGYVMNKMGPNLILDPRVRRLIDGLYESL